ncbi:MAG: GntR family transcriptional regulator [Devosia sp.]|nr:GntR family transcriptional regulator [Devosia sp.]
MSGKIERPRKINEVVLERMRNDIISGAFQLGEKLSEQQLADGYGVTKAPVRAAFGRLQSEGLVEIRAQLGTFVFRPSRDSLTALCELRTALELEAARLSMLRAHGRLSKVVTDIYNQMLTALEHEGRVKYQHLDTSLHLVFFELAQSPYLRATYQAQVSSAFAALRHRFAQARSHNEASIIEHREIVEAVQTNDLSRLRLAVRKHVDHTQAYYDDFLATE